MASFKTTTPVSALAAFKDSPCRAVASAEATALCIHIKHQTSDIKHRRVGGLEFFLLTFFSFCYFPRSDAVPRRARPREDRSAAAAMRLGPTKPQHNQLVGFSWSRNS